MADEFSKTKAPVAVLEYEPSGFELVLLKHKSKLILVAVLGVAGSLGYWGYKLYQEATNKTAAVAFVRAVTPDALRKVAAEHAGKPAGGSALIHAAQLVSADKPAEAAALLKDYLDKYPEHPLRSAATFRRAEYLSVAGDKPAAEKEYETVAAGDSPEAGFALLRLGDVQWAAGDTEKAKGFYTRLTSTASFAGSPARQEAQQRLDTELKVKAPDLVEYVEEKETPPAPAPSGFEPDPSVSPGDDFLPPPQTKIAAPASAPGPLSPGTGFNVPSLPGDVPAPEEDPADKAPASAEKPTVEGNKPTGGEPPAGTGKPAATDADSNVDKKPIEKSKPKVDDEKKPAKPKLTP